MLSKHFLPIVTYISICFLINVLCTLDIKGGESYNISDRYIEELDVYCHTAETVSAAISFKSLHANLVIRGSNYEIFDGQNGTSVRENQKLSSSSWLNLFPWKHTSIYFPIFQDYCIGIHTKEDYQISFPVRYINYWMLFQMIIGAALFIVAHRLSRNIIFYYSSGISIGVLASLLILVFVASKFIPFRKGAYGILIFGWSLVLYGFQLLVGNFWEILRSYSYALLAYIVFSSLVSFAVCYKYGPMGDVKTQNLIKWFLQLIGFVIIWFSSENKVTCTSVIIVLLTIHNFPQVWVSIILMKWYRIFPPKIKLLTEEEYIQQSSIETKKALEELRSFCRSPDCNAWKTIGRLKSPLRFADFVEGSSHITDQEIMSYDYDNHENENEYEEDYLTENDS